MIEFLRHLPYKTYTGMFLCSLFATYWLLPRIVWLARGLGLFSRTSSRDGHRSPTLGGLALGLPFIAGISLLLLLKNQVSENMYMVPLQMRGLFFCSCLALVLGLLQDLLKLNRYLLVALQCLVATIAFHHGFSLEVLPQAGGGAPAYLEALIPTLIWFVGIVNLVDLFQRLGYLNHLFLIFALLLTLVLLFAAYLLDQYRTIVTCCLLLGSLLGYLSHDSGLRPSMGSSGTHFFSYILAITALQSRITDGSAGPVVFVLGMSLLPLALAQRYRSRPAPRSGNRQHGGNHLRSLHHFQQAYALRIGGAEGPQEHWLLLCQAAAEFGYRGLVQRSSLGAPVREWGAQGEAGESHSFPLRCSGGELAAWIEERPADADLGEQNHLFASLVELFDRRQERAAMAVVSARGASQRVLLVNRYFGGMSATGQIASDLAEDLTGAGIAVTVLTGGTSYETGASLPGRNELIHDIHLYRVPATHFGRTNALNRAMDFIFFYLYSLAWILKISSARYTHIIAFTDPPLIALAGHLARKTKRWRFIYVIQDLYPETALALGILKQGWLFKVCDRINKALLREADAVVAIGQQMAVHLRVLVGNPRRLEVIHNWADGNRIRPKDRTQQPGLADRLGIREVFTVLYAGNMGLAQEIDALICLLRACKDRQDIQFLFVGGGVRRRDLIEAAATDRLTNVAFVSYQDRSDLSDLLALADIGVVTLTPALEGLAIPTRTYSYLAADLPLLAISGPNSELKLFAEDGLGAHFTPDAIEQMVQYLDTQIRQGRRARDNRYRRHFAKHFDRQGQTAKYIALLNTIPPPGQS